VDYLEHKEQIHYSGIFSFPAGRRSL
jgi:hypothetical protein